MKCLVTGGAGFIGSHLIDMLKEHGHSVVCVDDFSSGKPENISHLGVEEFSFYKSDVSDLRTLDRIFAKEDIDCVFHLAANSDIQSSAKNPEIELKNTLLTTYSVLECMRNHGVKHLFFASTSAVYGDKSDIALSESTCPLEPVSYYGGAKLSSEAFIHSFSYMNGLNSLIFRFPNVIGARLTHGVVYDFINRLKTNGKSLTILGDGAQTKPYMHVSDLISGIGHMMKIETSGVNIYNIGVKTKTSVMKIADIVCEEMGLSGVAYNCTGGKTGWLGDVPAFSYDLRKIHATGWSAKFTSDEAVRESVREVLACKL